MLNNDWICCKGVLVTEGDRRGVPSLCRSMDPVLPHQGPTETEGCKSKMKNKRVTGSKLSL